MSIVADLRYSPRVRPPRPPPLYFSALKQCPDEWQEDVWSIDSSSLPLGANQDFMVQCHVGLSRRLPTSQILTLCLQLFLPSVRVFSASESIPFHLSLRGSPSFLQSIVQSLAPDRAAGQEDCDYPIHVFMVRQTVVRKDQGKVVHEEILGTGELTTSDMTVMDEPVLDDTVFKSWNGLLRCEKSIACSGFTTPVLEVKVSEGLAAFLNVI